MTDQNFDSKTIRYLYVSMIVAGLAFTGEFESQRSRDCSVKRIRDPISLYRLFQEQIFICVAIDISNIQLLLTFMFHHLITPQKIFQP